MGREPRERDGRPGRRGSTREIVFYVALLAIPVALFPYLEPASRPFLERLLVYGAAAVLAWLLANLLDRALPPTRSWRVTKAAVRGAEPVRRWLHRNDPEDPARP